MNSRRRRRTRRVVDANSSSKGAIAAAAAESGVFVEVAENYGRRPAEQLNAAAIRAGLIGDLVHLSAYNAPANEESCYHTMSLFRSYAGCDVTEIRAAGRTLRAAASAVVGTRPDRRYR